MQKADARGNQVELERAIEPISDARAAQRPGKGSPMLLHSLIRPFDPQASLAGIPNSEITGVCEDSRRVGAGNLFIGRAGTKKDGRQFIRGAQAGGGGAAG